jgi:hypothetical protein
MVGRARAFLAMIQLAAPVLYEAFAALPQPAAASLPFGALSGLYSRIASADFSKQVLATHPEKLNVLCLGDVGWSDLGDPQRVVSTLSQHGLESPWVAPWHRAAAASAG